LAIQLEKATGLNANDTSIARPLVFGEVLFDCFPDRDVLGGAPLNVAWNLRGLGLDPRLITAIGNDDRGQAALAAIGAWGLDCQAIQIDTEHPTGRVDITLRQGEPTYRFLDDVAFDHIGMPSGEVMADRYGLFYHGSLVCRSQESMKTILAIRRSVRCPVFIDINVRQPFFDTTWIEPLLRDVDHLKLNADELILISDHAGGENTADTGRKDPQGGTRFWADLFQRARALQANFGVKTIWITLGERGAGCLSDDRQFFYCSAPSVEAITDTVGAGDAFAAIIIQGILAGTPPQESLRRATAFAARVCGLNGATTGDLDFYSS